MTRFANLKEFNVDLSRFKDLVPEEHIKLQKRIALDLLRRIVFRTPVDTGRARGNWQIRRTVTSAQFKKTDIAGGATVAAGVSSLSAITKPFGVIHVFNNVNYIRFLEGGSSAQTNNLPGGIVAISVAEVESQFA